MNPSRRPALVISAGAALLIVTPAGTAPKAQPRLEIAQAGSMGGVVGKADKSVSGGDEEGRGMPPGQYLYPVGLDPNGDNWLALRSQPYGRGVRIRKMGPAALVTVIGREGEWLHVRLAQTGEVGWASSRFLACCR